MKTVLAFALLLCLNSPAFAQEAQTTTCSGHDIDQPTQPGEQYVTGCFYICAPTSNFDGQVIIELFLSEGAVRYEVIEKDVPLAAYDSSENSCEKKAERLNRNNTK